MKILHESQIEPKDVGMAGAKDVTIQVLVSDADGAPNFAMRRFVITPGGHTPLHTHSHAHEVFILSGSGVMLFEGKEHKLRAGSFAFINPHAEHQFQNTGDDELVLLCMIPNLARRVGDFH